MNTAIQETTDQATAVAALNKARENLSAALGEYDQHTRELREKILALRPSGVLTVDRMAKAIDRKRNWIDTLWAEHGNVVKKKQTRAPKFTGDPSVAESSFEELKKLADAQRAAIPKVETARADRDRTIVMVYVSKILGPSAIAYEVGVDRNHVQRIVKAAGVVPVHRPDTVNQYTWVPDTVESETLTPQPAAE